eukprot:TRINITY_DN23976_c0_g1_i1.p1 TRINITY_DN23976_c0_g1~~TRINITY_DN23976_c0_g1_i1.p1  ORF type:complete len:197 (-),score=39.09 TRINITY_DN23976_c0_g1_i1:50-640(-)
MLCFDIFARSDCLSFFFFNDTATTEIYTRSIVGSVRCVQETGTWVSKLDKWKMLNLITNQSAPSFLSLLLELPTEDILIFSGAPSDKLLMFTPSFSTIKALDSFFTPSSDCFLQSSLIGDKIYSIGFNGKIHIFTLSTNSYQVITYELSLIHISEPTRPLYISYAVFCLKKKKNTNNQTVDRPNNSKSSAALSSRT